MLVGLGPTSNVALLPRPLTRLVVLYVHEHSVPLPLGVSLVRLMGTPRAALTSDLATSVQAFGMPDADPPELDPSDPALGPPVVAVEYYTVWQYRDRIL